MSEPTTDVCIELRVSLAEAIEGGRREVEYQRVVGCSACDGYGAAAAQREECRACSGSGAVSGPRAPIRCDACQGTGIHILQPCPRCEGLGGGSRSETLSVDIPAGIATGMQLRMQRKGDAPRRGREPGDLYVTITVEPEAGFVREGDDLFMLVHVARDLAERGGEVTASLPGGTAKLQVPAGTTTGDTQRWKGLGGLRLGARATRAVRNEARQLEATDARGDLITCFILDGDPVPPSAALRLEARGGRPLERESYRPTSDSVSPLLMAAVALLVFASIALVTWLRM